LNFQRAHGKVQKVRHIKPRTVLCLTVAVIVIIYFANIKFIEPSSACYGPCVTANIDKTKIDINGTVTVTGQVCPVGQNVNVSIIFTRPDYKYIVQDIAVDPKTGNFSVTQKLEMIGYWNIFALNGAILDRLFVVVTDPSNPNAPEPTPTEPLKVNTNFLVIGAAATMLILGTAGAIYGFRKKTIKFSSFRLLVQIGLLFLIFFGIFVDGRFPIPAAEISPHEDLVATSAFGIQMPDGLPTPFLSCYYPCGKTVTCALWELQTYIYPFFNTDKGWGVTYTSTGLERLAIVFGVIILAAVVLGRLFCGWVCPFGLYLDLVARIRKTLRIKRRNLSPRVNEKLHQLGYLILALIIIVSVLFGSQAIAGTQLVPGTQKGGLIWNYFSSPFCQVCPMKPLCVLVEMGVGIMLPQQITQTTSGILDTLGYYLTSINLLILVIVTIAAFFVSRSWCRICPLGALIALFNRFPPFKWLSGVRLNKQVQKCNNCGICKRVCPTQVREVYEQKSGDVASSQCIWCLRCVEMCPQEDCLQFKFVGKTIVKSRDWLASPSHG
jgi:Pyruvate/2-oxoacid:ferredoxin oxidoreductase delta subunit